MGTWDWIIDFVLDGFAVLIGWTGTLLRDALVFLKTLYNSMRNELMEFAEDPIAYIKDAIGTTLTGILQWLTDSFKNLAEFTTWLSTWFSTHILDTLTDVSNFLDTVWTTWLTNFYGWVTLFYDWAVSEIPKIWERWATISNYLAKIRNGLLFEINRFIDGYSDTWNSFLTALKTLIITVVTDIIEAAAEIGGAISNAVASGLKGILDSFGNMFGESQEEIDERFKEGEKPNWEDVDASNMHW